MKILFALFGSLQYGWKIIARVKRNWIKFYTIIYQLFTTLLEILSFYFFFLFQITAVHWIQTIGFFDIHYFQNLKLKLVFRFVFVVENKSYGHRSLDSPILNKKKSSFKREYFGYNPSPMWMGQFLFHFVGHFCVESQKNGSASCMQFNKNKLWKPHTLIEQTMLWNFPTHLMQ